MIIHSSANSTLPSALTRDRWAAIFTDVSRWLPVVADILRQLEFPLPQSVEAGYPGTCAVFVVDRALVVKIFPPLVPDDFARERAVLETLRSRLPEAPRLEAAGIYRDAIDWPFLILGYCPGRPTRELLNRLGNTERNRLAQELGAMLQTVHATPPPAPVTVPAWPDFLSIGVPHAVAGLQQLPFLSPALVDRLGNFLSDLEPSLRQEPPRLLHGDLTEDHLLLQPSPDGWRITCLIDWADTLVAPVGYEWVALWFGLCACDWPFFRNILAAYGAPPNADPSFRRRMLAYTLLHRFGPAIIRDRWTRTGQPHFSNLPSLQEWLWPEL